MPHISFSTLFVAGFAAMALQPIAHAADSPRERISIDADWRFIKGDPADNAVNLTYLIRPAGRGGRGGRGAAPIPAPAPGAATVPAATSPAGIYAWVLPSSNDFIVDAQRRFARPQGNLGDGVAYTLAKFDDASWRQLDLPHDWGIEGPFQDQGDGATGRLPYYGTAWYRKHLEIPAVDSGKKIYLDMDGAMAYSLVWLNGQFVGGWPFGYSSWRLDLTPYVKAGGENVLAIRLDNPANSSRWYPGGGIYRNVWLTKTDLVHVGQWGTALTTPEVSATSATVHLKVKVESNAASRFDGTVSTEIYALDESGKHTGAAVASISAATVRLDAMGQSAVESEVVISNPKLWSPKTPNRYVAVTTVGVQGRIHDRYETPFGIRTVTFDANKGLSINGEHYKMNGVCDHHDLGALGSAVNTRALQRQLEILKEMGCNAIRTSHNPPTPELLDLADQMGILIMDETFDTWRNQKRPNDYNLLFRDWSEQDTRMLVRRDRNHPSVILWSIGNEINEQTQGEAGADVAKRLASIVREEDPTRLVTAACNSAKPESIFPGMLDVMGLNYQGSRLATPRNPNGPQYPLFHAAFPNQPLFGSETASTISSRGEYTFPVAKTADAISENPGRGRGRGPAANPAAPPPPGPAGADGVHYQMSSYDIYHPDWATSPDTEFMAQDKYPYLAGEFVWTGFDYLGEPTPWGAGNDPSRSSYFGIIDLAGFPKDRYYLYQARWRPDFPMAHILPHWNWAERVGQVTPVHVYTSGDEAELFLNGKSQGRRKKGEFEYRLRWDDVVYEPGELRVVAYKDGKEWATQTVKTTGPAAKLLLKPDHATIMADGKDLSFVTLTVADAEGLMVPRSKQPIHFDITGPGEIIATDNGDATDHTIFASKDRKAFNGLALAIIKPKAGQPGTITVTARSEGLANATTTITTK